jgi:hypothetical protein
LNSSFLSLNFGTQREFIFLNIFEGRGKDAVLKLFGKKKKGLTLI